MKMRMNPSAMQFGRNDIFELLCNVYSKFVLIFLLIIYSNPSLFKFCHLSVKEAATDSCLSPRVAENQKPHINQTQM